MLCHRQLSKYGDHERKPFKFGKQWSEAWELGLGKRRGMGR